MFSGFPMKKRAVFTGNDLWDAARVGYPLSCRKEIRIPLQADGVENVKLKTTGDWLATVKGRDDERLFHLALDWSVGAPAEVQNLLIDDMPKVSDLQQGKWVSFLNRRDEWLM